MHQTYFIFVVWQVRQEETVPESEPPTGPETDTVTKNPSSEHTVNDVPKREDAAKETSQPDDVARKDKPEKKDKKEFSKYSGPSRGPRHPVDKTGKRWDEEKFKQNGQRRTEKKRPTTRDRPNSVEQRERQKDSEKEPDNQRRDFAIWAEAKPDSAHTELKSEENASAVDLPEKVESNVSGSSNYNSKSMQNSNGDRPRSARRGRGRSRRNRPSGSVNESRDGVKNMNKSRTASREAVKRSDVAGPPENSKPSQEKNGRLQDQRRSLEENPSDDGGRNKDKVCKPPPGFKNLKTDKGGCEQSTNVSRPPPGFEQHSTRPRPPPGFGNLPPEGSGQKTSQSITS